MREISCLLIRHGMTIGNIEKRYVGSRTDEALCEQGINELKSVSLADRVQKLQNGILDGRILKLQHNGLADGTLKLWNKVFVSPLTRCIQTADILFPDCEKKVVEDFRETDFGEFENKNYLELKDNSDYQKWIDSNGSLPFPGGEAREEFTERTVNAFRRILNDIAVECDGRTVPFVIHGGSIMAIMSELTGKDYYDFQIPCGCVYILRCRIEEEKIDVISYDRISCRSDS